MTMKLLFQQFIILLWCLPTYGQGEFHQFLSKLNLLKNPVTITCENELDTLTVNRLFAWKYLISSATKINKQKSEQNQFPIDSNDIILYKQWEGFDWSKSEAISLYTPIFSGSLYCGGQLNLGESIVGILWIIYENDMFYGHGFNTYLFTYNEHGEALDFLNVNKCLEGGSPLETFRIHDKTQITSDSILITTSEFQETYTDTVIPTKENILKRKFAITQKGRIEEITN